MGGHIPALKHRELLSVVCGDEAVGGEMGTMLWWVAALLCRQRCCEKVCGRCESSVWKERRLCPSPGGTAEPLQMAAVASLHWGHAVGWENGSALHREGSTNPRRNTSFEQLMLLLSPGRDNLVSWGKEEALDWAWTWLRAPLPAQISAAVV